MLLLLLLLLLLILLLRVGVLVLELVLLPLALALVASGLRQGTRELDAIVNLPCLETEATPHKSSAISQQVKSMETWSVYQVKVYGLVSSHLIG